MRLYHSSGMIDQHSSKFNFEVPPHAPSLQMLNKKAKVYKRKLENLRVISLTRIGKEKFFENGNKR